MDTIAPVGQVSDVTIISGDTVTADDFFTSQDDISDVSASFATLPDYDTDGTQEITLYLTDAYGNSTTYTASLTIRPWDDEPPVFNGVEDFTVYLDDTISYKSRFSITDNLDDDVQLSVDGTVDTHTEGVYPITLTATDYCGNSTSADINVTVIKPAYSLDEVDAAADEVLSSILKDGMTDMDKLNAIYNWVQANVGWIEHSEKGDWIQGAYEGLIKRQGDCYVYACTSKELLTRAGIKNMDIHKIPTSSTHYWNLVDIGEGWYHFDTTPRNTDKRRFCYVSDAEFMEYSHNHWNCFNYDTSVFTDIQ